MVRLDPRWAALVTYVPASGELVPIEVVVRLLPADFPEDAPEDPALFPATADGSDVPAGGLSQRMLNSVRLEAGRKKLEGLITGDAGQMPDHVRARLREVFGEQLTGRTAGPGRPRRDPLEVLRACLAVEQGTPDRKTLDQVAAELGVDRPWLKEALNWARRQDPPLFTTPGRGRRGGALTPEGRALLAELGGADQEE
ncbi:hypothetical protein [Streptomyces sp. NPDC088847]|uniref:hypothetical protein n=1 Tax=Streptomyces sp. NPDC088847 TaxID=3365909 RepID=UPI003816ABB3